MQQSCKGVSLLSSSPAWQLSWLRQYCRSAQVPVDVGLAHCTKISDDSRFCMPAPQNWFGRATFKESSGAQYLCRILKGQRVFSEEHAPSFSCGCLKRIWLCPCRMHMPPSTKLSASYAPGHSGPADPRTSALQVCIRTARCPQIGLILELKDCEARHEFPPSAIPHGTMSGLAASGLTIGMGGLNKSPDKGGQIKLLDVQARQTPLRAPRCSCS